jgi:hypothetical protein
MAKSGFYSVESPFSDRLLGTFYANMSPACGVRLEAYARFGELIDYANNQLDVDDGELFNAQQSDIRLTYQFDMRSYIRMVVQYTDITRNQSLYDDVDANSKHMNTQLLYSYKINPQTLFFLATPTVVIKMMS